MSRCSFSIIRSAPLLFVRPECRLSASDQAFWLLHPATLAEPDSQVVYLHRRIDGRDVYFFGNNNPEPIEIRPAMRAAGPWKLYRPLTGEVTDAGDDPKLTLAGYEGVFVVN